MRKLDENNIWSFYYFQLFCQNSIIICKTTLCFHLLVWKILQNRMRAIEKTQNLINWFWINEVALRFILPSLKLLDNEKYLHIQQLYRIWYNLHKILSSSIVKKLKESNLTCTKSSKSVINWWFCNKIHIMSAKMVWLWKISLLTTTIQHAG